MTQFDKAIRDKIPEIIKESGKNCNMKKLKDSEFLIELEKKLIEELTEYQESKDVEELADILEVVYRISELKGITSDELDHIKNEKAKKRCKFADNLFLVDTD